jgi:phosphoglycerate dehydrogenase-like enzyme
VRIVSRPLVARPQLEQLAAKHGVTLVSVDDAAGMLREVDDADALWLWPAFYDAALAAALERNAARLRWLQLMTMGFDPLEQFGAPSTLTITNAGDAYAPTVAEHALTLLLALLRRVAPAVRNVAEHRWEPALSSEVATLNDAVVAVIGFGSIGREIAVRLRACGARIIAVTRSGRSDPRADEVVTVDALRDVFARSDAVVIALPLTAQTRGLIDAAALAALPPHAVLVNIARGGIIDQAALDDALREGRLAGAGLDVTTPEPLPPTDPLWDAPNVIITPHIAGYGGMVPARRVIALIERNLLHALAGEPLEARITLAAR